MSQSAIVECKGCHAEHRIWKDGSDPFMQCDRCESSICVDCNASKWHMLPICVDCEELYLKDLEEQEEYKTQEEETAEVIINSMKLGLFMSLVIILVGVSSYEYFIQHHTPIQQICSYTGHCWNYAPVPLQVERGEGR